MKSPQKLLVAGMLAAILAVPIPVVAQDDSEESRSVRFDEIRKELVERLRTLPEATPSALQMEARRILDKHGVELASQDPEQIRELLASDDLQSAFTGLQALQKALDRNESPFENPEELVSALADIIWRFRDGFADFEQRFYQMRQIGDPLQIPRENYWTLVMMLSVRVLQQHPEEAVAWLESQWDSQSPQPLLVALTGKFGAASEPLAGRLLEAAESEDLAVRFLAVSSLGSILEEMEDEIEQRERQRRPVGRRAGNAEAHAELARRAAAIEEVDERSLSMARRIVNRNDVNGDGVLAPDEWEKLLMDVSPADLDDDGRLTVEEYARYLLARVQHLKQ